MRIMIYLFFIIIGMLLLPQITLKFTVIKGL